MWLTGIAPKDGSPGHPHFMDTALSPVLGKVVSLTRIYKEGKEQVCSENGEEAGGDSGRFGKVRHCLTAWEALSDPCDRRWKFRRLSDIAQAQVLIC